MSKEDKEDKEVEDFKARVAELEKLVSANTKALDRVYRELSKAVSNLPKIK